MSRFFALLLTLALTQAAHAQNVYEILREQGQGFAAVVPGLELRFPRDHGIHPSFRIEWWYITANLVDTQGRHWGLQWTLFRQALSPVPDTRGWNSNQLWMAHAALTTPQFHRFEQRFARGGIGQAGVSDIRRDGFFDAWIDDWQWRSEGAALFPSVLHFDVGGRQVQMQLNSSADWVLHGEGGYSQKSAQGQASYYYSQPQIQIQGTVSGAGEDISLSGVAWLDREWSSQALAPNQSGWDWFSLHLDDGNKLMLYRLRQDDGAHWLSASWINGRGETRQLSPSEIELEPGPTNRIDIGAGKQIEIPLEWTLKLPAQGLNLSIKALYDQQWMATRYPYWEGVVTVKNSAGLSVGKGYMELTGYD